VAPAHANRMQVHCAGEPSRRKFMAFHAGRSGPE
jgi:hypothetical protein